MIQIFKIVQEINLVVDFRTKKETEVATFYNNRKK